MERERGSERWRAREGVRDGEKGTVQAEGRTMEEQEEIKEG
jgi:hypothetical protein